MMTSTASLFDASNGSNDLCLPRWRFSIEQLVLKALRLPPFKLAEEKADSRFRETIV